MFDVAEILPLTSHTCILPEDGVFRVPHHCDGEGSFVLRFVETRERVAGISGFELRYCSNSAIWSIEIQLYRKISKDVYF